MTTSLLSGPTLVTRDDLKSYPILTISVMRLVNDAFYRSKATVPSKWDNRNLRFPNEEAFYAMLTTDSVFALIFDLTQNAQFDVVDKSTDSQSANGISHIYNKKVVACAAAVPWKGGWTGEGAGIEKGWEMKTVCVDGDTKYLRKGLAVHVLKSLEDHLVSMSTIERQKADIKQDEDHLQFWILAAECQNGAYWRKKGYAEVRRKTEGVGVWSCKTNFDMVVLRRTVTIDKEA